MRLVKGKPPAQQRYYGADSAWYLTPEYLRGAAACERAKPSANAVHIRDGDTVLLWDGSNAGEVLLGRSGVLASTMTRVSSDSRFTPSYFFFALKQWESYLKSQTSGSGIPHVDKEVLGKLEITEFAESEQSKIAEVLSTVDRAIAQTKELIAKQQRIKIGLMRDLLTLGIDEAGQLRSEATHAFEDSPLGRIPMEWDLARLGDVADVNRGKFTHRPRDDARFYGGSHPFIQTGDVAANVGRTVDDFSQTLSIMGTRVSNEFPKGTIAITIAANIADTAILGRPMYFPDSVAGAIAKAPNSIRFIEMTVRRHKPALEQLAPKSAQSNINLETLRPLVIALPKPAEQERIATAYEAADERQISNEQSLRKLRHLKTALMQDLLTGKVRVTPLLQQAKEAIA
ncbi:hypothetical protein MCC10107_1971 [Bifidobacterium longum subsp. longum]|nr:hypothetical protein MCC10107_1971 [Bifidobacterium longum subsp. longum]